MARSPLRGATLLATALLGVWAAASAPAAAADGRCRAGTGVTVVVDRGPLGGGTDLRCDPDGGGRTALDVVARAGFALGFVVTQPGFVCRIDGVPGQETCRRTPPADAYWALFSSDGSGGWTYASIGVASLRVPEGGSIGWRFQDGGARDYPGAPPTVGAAPDPSPDPEPTGPAGPTTKPTKPARPARPAKPSRPSPTSPSPTPSSTESSAPGGGSGSGSGSGDSSSASSESPRSTGPDGASSGSGKPDRPGPARADGGRKQRSPDANRRGANDDRPGTGEPASATTAQDTTSESNQTLGATSQPASPGSGGSALMLVAGGAMVALAAAAGIITWRRRS